MSRRPPMKQIETCADILSKALRTEAERVREREGHAGHHVASDLEADARRILLMPSRIHGLRKL